MPTRQLVNLSSRQLYSRGGFDTFGKNFSKFAGIPISSLISDPLNRFQRFKNLNRLQFLGQIFIISYEKLCEASFSIKSAKTIFRIFLVFFCCRIAQWNLVYPIDDKKSNETVALMSVLLLRPP